MSWTSSILLASVAALVVGAAPAVGQSASAHTGHLVIVQLVTKGGSSPYGFDPASITAQFGDTVRFVEEAGVIHNIHFKSHPSGARLGSETVGPFLTTKGQTYDVVIDSRFPTGKYEFVCDPHEMLGMHGVLTVGNGAAIATSTK